VSPPPNTDHAYWNAGWSADGADRVLTSPLARNPAVVLGVIPGYAIDEEQVRVIAGREHHRHGPPAICSQHQPVHGAVPAVERPDECHRPDLGPRLDTGRRPSRPSIRDLIDCAGEIPYSDGEKSRVSWSRAHGFEVWASERERVMDMMRMLVATDSSPHALRAAGFAARLARDLRGPRLPCSPSATFPQ
jgi:hypothetical protein